MDTTTDWISAVAAFGGLALGVFSTGWHIRNAMRARRANLTAVAMVMRPGVWAVTITALNQDASNALTVTVRVPERASLASPEVFADYGATRSAQSLIVPLERHHSDHHFRGNLIALVPLDAASLDLRLELRSPRHVIMSKPMFISPISSEAQEQSIVSV